MIENLKLPTYESYDDMLACGAWTAGLDDLNTHLANTLSHWGQHVELNGNLFYAHRDPDYRHKGLLERFDGKRRNLFWLARQSAHLFEVGVNGGHSLYLALSANPTLRVTGVDICKQLSPTWARVDIYVPAAFAWLRHAFPGRCRFITGNSLVELPKYADENPSETIDLLHLDGSKDTHLREFLALKPLMPKGAFLLQDDTNMGPVRMSMRQILQLGLAERVDADHPSLLDLPGHKVLLVT